MLGQSIRPTTIKSYIDGNHTSICESCANLYRCKKYDRQKKVFYCSARQKPSEVNKNGR